MKKLQSKKVGGDFGEEGEKSGLGVAPPVITSAIIASLEHILNLIRLFSIFQEAVITSLLASKLSNFS